MTETAAPETGSNPQRISGLSKLSDLMSLAINDIEKTVVSGIRQAHMGRWGGRDYSAPMEHEPCPVCLSGAVMIESGIKPDYPEVHRKRGTLDDASIDRLIAIDECRRGYPGFALKTIGAAVQANSGLQFVERLVRTEANEFRNSERTMSPAAVDRGIEYWREKVIPAMQKAGM